MDLVRKPIVNSNSFRKNTEDNIFIVNIESSPAIDALDEILAVEGLDAVLIGPHDLTTNLGVPEQYEHPEFLKNVETIFRKARARNIGAGIHYWGSIPDQLRFIDMGANFLIHKADVIFFRTGLEEELAMLRQSGNGETNPESTGEISL